MLHFRKNLFAFLTLAFCLISPGQVLSVESDAGHPTTKNYKTIRNKRILKSILFAAPMFLCSQYLPAFQLDKKLTSFHQAINKLLNETSSAPLKGGMLSYRYSRSLAEQTSGPKLLIARSFSYPDLDKLEKSFDEWHSNVPCRKTKNIGLILYFSGSFAKNPDIEIRVKDLKYRLNSEKSPWGKCFQKVEIFDADIPRSQDIYNESAYGIDLNWVLGPNLQFNRLLNDVNTGRFGDFDLLYLMEPDSVPLKPYWLDAIIDEIRDEAPFAILGSEYLGDKWSDFSDVMPFSLLHHINGNAIYNISHSKMQNLLSQLSAELGTPKRATAYDLRISEIMLNQAPLSDLRSSYYKSSKVLGNYASTDMEHNNYGKEYVAHGAREFAHWSVDENIDLVISDWGNGDYVNILRSLNSFKHPFKNIFIVGPDSMADVDFSKEAGFLNVRFVPRGMENAGKDWLLAPIESEWFMYTNSYFVALNNHILIEELGKDQINPVLGTLSIDSPYCSAYADCVNSVIAAMEFNPYYQTHSETKIGRAHV